ncbi:hypothetical protein IWQ47_004416 [Aquimarina sp. EL_43]|nr:hypothetical protein [Aquimarina sp. EL_35]MBG6153169.1 hypothetical protein [Aquimarina sp. EL_32]MBG6171325.1 hypothetical protein [Aquimarina sp. EL_43]
MKTLYIKFGLNFKPFINFIKQLPASSSYAIHR